MSKRTASKLGRMYTAELKDGQTIITKKDVVDPAQPRQAITFTYGGREITVMVAPGQVINKKKAYKREMEKLGLYSHIR